MDMEIDRVWVPARRERTAIALQVEAMDRVIEPTAVRCRCNPANEQLALGDFSRVVFRAIEHGDLDQLALSDVETKEIAVDGGTEGGADRRVARDRRGLADRKSVV